MSQKTIAREELAKYLASTLDITRFRDYCPNGLQVEGRSQIETIVTGVTASVALLEAAIEKGADAILVHHGYFWRGEDLRVIGQKHKRLKLLLEQDVNLFAYHLPLDMHAEFGNNAQLARVIGFRPESRFGEDDLGWLGVMDDAALIDSVGALARQIEERLGRAPLLVGDPAQKVRKIGWCTGAAQSLLDDAIAAGADVYLSGEISEPTVHLAREAGVAYLACGHHATERYGIKALGEHIEKTFGVRHYFIDIDNPV
jgi:dinuclear metal center YbgI/SA1388 family protein